MQVGQMQVGHRAGGEGLPARRPLAHGQKARAIALAEADFADTLPPSDLVRRPPRTGERLAWPAAAAGIGVLSAALWLGIFALGRLILG